MNENKKTKALVEELENEFPNTYDRINYGLYVLVIDENGTQGHVRPIVKPDLDNYIKSTLDALNGVIWTDDATIVELNTSKWYADDPRIEIEVKELKNDEERKQN